jgi:hypothetical protein
MDDPIPRLPEGPPKLQGLPAGAVMTEAKRLARKAVQAQWQREGRKVHWVPYRELVEAANAYLDMRQAELVAQLGAWGVADLFVRTRRHSAAAQLPDESGVLSDIDRATNLPRRQVMIESLGRRIRYSGRAVLIRIERDRCVGRGVRCLWYVDQHSGAVWLTITRSLHTLRPLSTGTRPRADACSTTVRAPA